MDWNSINFSPQMARALNRPFQRHLVPFKSEMDGKESRQFRIFDLPQSVGLFEEVQYLCS